MSESILLQAQRPPDIPHGRRLGPPEAAKHPAQTQPPEGECQGERCTALPANGRPLVAFIVPFLGNWPKWTSLFFRSVEINPSIHVIVLCERRPRLLMPSNVTLIEVSRLYIIKRLELVTGLRLADISGHKLCDFRPFFGLAFADMLEEYQFWGFCDTDLMFGNLEQVINTEFLNSVDVFTAHNSQIVGHFTILRNTELINRLGFQIESWRERCTSPLTTALDELPFSAVLGECSLVRWKRTDPLLVELKRPFCRFGVSFDFDGEIAYLQPNPVALVEWRNGRVLYSDSNGMASELLYVHFMGLKRWWHWIGFDVGDGCKSTHRFSRVGYGGPLTVQDVVRTPWREIYATQRSMMRIKSFCGKRLRSLLPIKQFLRIRRLMLGSGRY